MTFIKNLNEASKRGLFYSCQTCTYLEAYEDEEGVAEFGYCHRNPPTAVVNEDGYIAGIFPQVDLSDRCGEYLNLNIGESK